MTKGTVPRKRLAFGVPKYAAIKATIQRNSTESPLLRLPVEIRERIWSLILGGGLLHVAFEPLIQYGSDLDDFYRGGKNKVLATLTWSANYCTLKGSEQHSNAVALSTPLQDSTYACDEHPHAGCDTVSHRTNKDNRPHLQVLRTCRQVYLEASRVLWNTNTFSFDDPIALRMFMDNRKTAQKQLLRKLRLDMTWHSRSEKCDWERVLTLTLIRSLKGLRTFHLYIEQSFLDQDVNWKDKPDWETDLLSDTFKDVMKFKVLPLETVTVNIANGPTFMEYERHSQWPLAGRTEWAERLKSQLLDPEDVVRWQERQDHIREAASQRKEERAQTRAKQTCPAFSSEEECAKFHQQRQDDKDKRSGRVRKAKKVAGPCGRQHVCLLCFWKGGPDRYEVARNCREPGYCNVVDETTS